MDELKNNHAYQLAIRFHREAIPIILDGKYDPNWTDQIKRAILSIVLNIAEGIGRGKGGHRRQFLLIANGSAYESYAALEVGPEELKWLKKDLAEVIEFLDQDIYFSNKTGIPSLPYCIEWADQKWTDDRPDEQKS